jgi:LacI family transcriptional regulator
MFTRCLDLLICPVNRALWRLRKWAQMTCLRDMATRANASVATVSRVIKDTGYVNAETRARVEQVIVDLEYIPNAGALRLRRGASHMVGVILPAPGLPFFGIRTHVLERELISRG